MSPELHDWIFGHDKFTRQYEQILLDSVSAQFDNIKKKEFDADNVSIEYLLNCSSLLSTSTELSHSEVALRIAQYALTSDRYQKSHKLAAAAILNTMANSLSLELAIKNNFLFEKFYKEFGLSQFLNFKRASLSHKLFLDTENISVNDFQMAAWEALNSIDCIVLSAPTSVGKSYLLLQWIIGEVRKA